MNDGGATERRSMFADESVSSSLNQIRFYRAAGKYGFLSNLYPSMLSLPGRLCGQERERLFPTAEHAYQFGKPRDPAVREWLMAAPKPHLVASTAHSLFVFDVVPDWNNTKVERMRQVLISKFVWDKDIRVALLATGDATLIEASSTDSFWGVGKNGKGKNTLGELLMWLRGELRRRGGFSDLVVEYGLL